MIASIVPMDLKNKMSDDIRLQIQAFLARGGTVNKIATGRGSASPNTYRDIQSKMAKINSEAKKARL